MATLGALIERNIWLIYTPQAAAFVVTAMVVVWGIVLLKAGKHRRPPDTNELVVMLTALYVSVAYLILYPTVATARTQALLRIYEFLPVQDPAKALLFRQCYTGNALSNARRPNTMVIQHVTEQRLFTSITWMALPSLAASCRTCRPKFRQLLKFGTLSLVNSHVFKGLRLACALRWEGGIAWSFPRVPPVRVVLSVASSAS